MACIRIETSNLTSRALQLWDLPAGTCRQSWQKEPTNQRLLGSGSVGPGPVRERLLLAVLCMQCRCLFRACRISSAAAKFCTSKSSPAPPPPTDTHTETLGILHAAPMKPRTVYLSGAPEVRRLGAQIDCFTTVFSRRQVGPSALPTCCQHPERGLRHGQGPRAGY